MIAENADEYKVNLKSKYKYNNLVTTLGLQLLQNAAELNEDILKRNSIKLD